MATHIRLKRMGRRNRPFFRVVVMDSRAKRDGAPIEELGWYDPVRTQDNFSLKAERILHWLQEGGQPSDTVKNLMKTSGLAYRWHLMRQGLDEKTIDQEIQKLALDRQERETKKASEESEPAEQPEPEAGVKAGPQVEEADKLEERESGGEVEKEETETAAGAEMEKKVPGEEEVEKEGETPEEEPEEGELTAKEPQAEAMKDEETPEESSSGRGGGKEPASPEEKNESAREERSSG
ncbi:MAG: 30S ribosomal protein S16 [Fidelibacterota bacterium]